MNNDVYVQTPHTSVSSWCDNMCVKSVPDDTACSRHTIQVLSGFVGHRVTTCLSRVSLMTLPAADSYTGIVRLCWTQCDSMCVKTLPAADIAIQVLSGFVVGHSVTAQPAQHSHRKWSEGCQQCGLLHQYLPVNSPLFWVKLFLSSSSLLLLYCFFFLDGVWGGGIDHLALTYSPVKKGVCGTH